MFYRIVKDKILQKNKVLENLKIYLIERSFLTNGQIILLVCSNYNKKKRTYEKCERFLDPNQAYDYYNHCCKMKSIVEIEDEANEESLNDSTI